jgi:hypothetical protein
MNVRDSEHMIAELGQKESYELTDTLEEADLIIINTCSVREKPVAKLFSEIGVFNKRRKEGAKIGVTLSLGQETSPRLPTSSTKNMPLKPIRILMRVLMPSANTAATLLKRWSISPLDVIKSVPFVSYQRPEGKRSLSQVTCWSRRSPKRLKAVPKR